MRRIMAEILVVCLLVIKGVSISIGAFVCLCLKQIHIHLLSLSHSVSFYPYVPGQSLLASSTFCMLRDRSKCDRSILVLSYLYVLIY